MKYIVARWQEDVSWADGLDADIVQKGEHLPNVGREPTSFLWWMFNHDVDPDETYVFLQGEPFHHDRHVLSVGPVDRYTPLSAWEVTCDGEGRPHHPGVPVAHCYERWFGRPFPGSVTFWNGGQFAIPGRLILSRPRPWYQLVYDDIMAHDGGSLHRPPDQMWPWAMERLWPAVYGGAA